MLKDLSIEDYLKRVQSSKPIVPSGGSVAALCAALASSLSQLVVNVTIGKTGYEDVEEEMKCFAEKLMSYTHIFTNAIDEDAVAYEKVIKKNNRDAALKESVLIPLKLCKTSFEVIDNINMLESKVNKNALGDLIAGKLLLKTVIQISINNIKINSNKITDKSFISSISNEISMFEKKLDIKRL